MVHGDHVKPGEDATEAKEAAFELIEATFVGVKNPKAEVERGFRFWDAVRRLTPLRVLLLSVSVLIISATLCSYSLRSGRCRRPRSASLRTRSTSRSTSPSSSRLQTHGFDRCDRSRTIGPADQVEGGEGHSRSDGLFILQTSSFETSISFPPFENNAPPF